MFKMNERAMNDKSWPKDCIWPAPIGEYGGIHWDEDLIPDELDDETEELVEIKEYFDALVEEGRLNEDYSLNEDYVDDDCSDDKFSNRDDLDAEDLDGDEAYADEDFDDDEPFSPVMGEDYWDDGFDIDAWRLDLAVCLNRLKIDIGDTDPVDEGCRIIGYRFVNENLLRQAFTRRAFQLEYHLSGCGEELEFMGDSVLNLFVTKELMKHFADVSAYDTDAPFRSKYDEGEFSKLKAKFVCKEHLSKRCAELGLEAYILYGTGEEHTDSSREDVIEAIIGAVAMDCDWDWDVLEVVIDRLIDLQIDHVDEFLQKSYYDIFNAWHQRHFGRMPEYCVYKKYESKDWTEWSYEGDIKFDLPENDQDLPWRQYLHAEQATRSRVRELLAEFAYRYVVRHGLWINLKDAHLVPALDQSINQLQELYQKGYIDQAAYSFTRDGGQWECVCRVNDVYGKNRGYSKAEAKKYAAYEALVLILQAGGCCEDAWFQRMIMAKYDQKLERHEYIVDSSRNSICEIGEAADACNNNSIAATKDTREDVRRHTIQGKNNGKDKAGRFGLKYHGLVAVLNQIPEGKVITEGVLIKWLSGAYGIENLQLLSEEIPRPHLRVKDVPFHRFLTTRGLVDESYVEVLKAEGHEIVATKTTNWRVLDYKDTLVEVNTLTVPEQEKAVGQAEDYRKFVADA